MRVPPLTKCIKEALWRSQSAKGQAIQSSSCNPNQFHKEIQCASVSHSSIQLDRACGFLPHPFFLTSCNRVVEKCSLAYIAHSLIKYVICWLLCKVFNVIKWDPAMSFRNADTRNSQMETNDKGGTIRHRVFLSCSR